LANTGGCNWDGREDMAYIPAILDGINWWTLTPFASGDTSVLSNRGTLASNTWVSGGLTADGQTLIAYSSRGGTNFTVNTLAAFGAGTHEWQTINTATGAQISSGTGVTNASGQNRSCGAAADCVFIATNVPPVSSRGPSGQWPPGFHAYANTAPGVVVAANTSAVQSAMTSGTCTDANGCTIEFTGTSISGTTFSSRGGSGPIVVRPPIGQRAEKTLGNVVIRVDGLLFAGFQATGEIKVQITNNNILGLGSGGAWLDSGAGTNLRPFVECYGDGSKGIFYEIVARHYGSSEDRGGTRGNGGGTCSFTLVGSYLAGDNGPLAGHPDTLQDYQNGSTCPEFIIRDSILWSSTDKVLQTEYEPGSTVMEVDNCILIGPAESDSRWFFPGELPTFNPANVTVNAIATITNSTLIGGQFNGSYVSVGDSELWNIGGSYTNLGGNDTSPPTPATPPLPTDAYLDTIWSP
jgi:hypothetical protein